VPTHFGTSFFLEKEEEKKKTYSFLLISFFSPFLLFYKDGQSFEEVSSADSSQASLPSHLRQQSSGSFSSAHYQ
jgi:hypothetical protein